MANAGPNPNARSSSSCTLIILLPAELLDFGRVTDRSGSRNAIATSKPPQAIAGEEVRMEKVTIEKSSVVSCPLSVVTCQFLTAN